MFNKELDLHGLHSEEAIAKISTAMIDLESSLIDALYVQTGIGTGVMQAVLEDFIFRYNATNDYKISYETLNNGGVYKLIIHRKKHQKRLFWFCSKTYEETPNNVEIVSDFDAMVEDFKYQNKK
ncbi:Smr/MutS family protein [Mycoplasmopsis mustelae]|uniref:Smr/MutS family protein n=1 Tax=Mycoplasmopsis mustelae TaxID=171289 RepID=UPI001066C69C|nr:Smr/MutS family protein [Mycoplasmopsis mustelae]